ncbi:MAG: DNA replication/repair protein RecF [Acidiferrobacterales bacterium]
MLLTRLEIHNIRLLGNVVMEPGAALNLIQGRNASGKTSLLEAIHLLSTGQSFRTKQLSQLVQKGTDGFVVSGQISRDGEGTRIGLQYDGRNRAIHLGGARVTSAAALASAVPLQAITADTHHEFMRTSAYRRGVLDWWLFHVEPDFYSEWSRYQRLINQRNAALRAKLPQAARYVWDEELAATGERLNHWRAGFVEHWRPEFGRIAECLLGYPAARLTFHRGWPDDRSLLEQLRSDRVQDELRGYTRSGPHRADLGLVFDDDAARNSASHGQQKALIVALRLAQVHLFTQRAGRRCILLADDVGAELDYEHRERVIEALSNLGSQVFVTAIEAYDAPAINDRVRVFHVEQGRLTAAKIPDFDRNRSLLTRAKMLE